MLPSPPQYLIHFTSDEQIVNPNHDVNVSFGLNVKAWVGSWPDKAEFDKKSMDLLRLFEAVPYIASSNIPSKYAVITSIPWISHCCIAAMRR